MLEGSIRESVLNELDRLDSWPLWPVATVQYAMGREADSAPTLEEMKRQPDGNEDGIAWVGALDDAFAWFEKAYALREYGLLSLKCSENIAPKVVRDPRCSVLLRRMKLPD